MSTGVKHDSGKPAMELIDADAMEDLARVLEFGRRKYGAHNWRGGIGIGRLIGAALRHTFAFMRGEDTDPESGLPHLAHAMCSIMFAMWTVRHHPGLHHPQRMSRRSGQFLLDRPRYPSRSGPLLSPGR